MIRLFNIARSFPAIRSRPPLDPRAAHHASLIAAIGGCALPAVIGIFAYGIVLALTMGSAALFYLAASDDRDNKALNDLLHQAAFDSISERLVAMGLPRDGLQRKHQPIGR